MSPAKLVLHEARFWRASTAFAWQPAHLPYISFKTWLNLRKMQDRRRRRRKTVMSKQSCPQQISKAALQGCERQQWFILTKCILCPCANLHDAVSASHLHIELQPPKYSPCGEMGEKTDFRHFTTLTCKYLNSTVKICMCYLKKKSCASLLIKWCEEPSDWVVKKRQKNCRHFMEWSFM